MEQFDQSNSARAISQNDVVETVARLQKEMDGLASKSKETKEQVSERKGMQYASVIAFVALTERWSATETRNLTEELAVNGVSRAVAKRLVDRSIMAVRGSQRARTKPVDGVVDAAKADGARGVYEALKTAEADNEQRLWKTLNRDRRETADEAVLKLAKLLVPHDDAFIAKAIAKAEDLRAEKIKAEADKVEAAKAKAAEKAAKAKAPKKGKGKGKKAA